MWHILVMECYLAVKRNEVQTCATMWMQLENVLSENRAQKTAYCVLPFVRNVHNKPIHTLGLLRAGKDGDGVAKWVTTEK
jgi:hypothetical protein